MQWAIWGNGIDPAQDMEIFNQWKIDHPDLVISCGICTPTYEFITCDEQEHFTYSGQLGCNSVWDADQCNALTAAGVKVRFWGWQGPIWPNVEVE